MKSTNMATTKYAEGIYFRVRVVAVTDEFAIFSGNCTAGIREITVTFLILVKEENYYG